MNKILVFIAAFIATVSIISCQDGTTTFGSSLITDETTIIVDSSFTITGRSLTDPVVQSRTTTQLIGRLQAEEYGDITSDVVMQFMPAMNVDTVGITAESIDSVKMLMFMSAGDFTGDSLVPMGLQVYMLDKQLPSPIFSDFSPEGYYNPDNVLASQVYTANALHSDSLNELTYRTISVNLPLQFGKDLFNHYIERPEDFADPDAFTSWFPGFYVTNSFGSGLVVNVGESRINLYYKKKSTYENTSGEMQDTIYEMGKTYLVVAPEVITNNNIKFRISDYLQNKINQGEALVVTPTGTEVEITFPTVDIISAYRNGEPQLSVLNTLDFKIPAEAIDNEFGINPPIYLLMVLADKKTEFFSKNKITDSKTSFMGMYDAVNGVYDFGNLKGYITEMMAKDELTPDDYTFILTPVNVETETSSDSYYGSGTSYVVGISPYVTKPAMVKLNLEDAKIKLTYTRQSAKN